MRRVLALVALVLVAGSCAAAASAATPRPQARADLKRCQATLVTIHFGPVTAKTLARQKRLVAAARSACGDKAKLQALANAHSSDSGLSQAASAEVGIADGLANYAKYLADVAAGKAGHTKILTFAVEEIRQARLLLAEALRELK